MRDSVTWVTLSSSVVFNRDDHCTLNTQYFGISGKEKGPIIRKNVIFYWVSCASCITFLA